MRTVLITLIAPDRTADLVVDADTPVVDLLPNLLAAGGAQLSSTEEPTAGEDPGSLDTVVEWVGHLNDFGGAASVGVIKGYDAAVSKAGDSLMSEIDAATSDPDTIAAIKAGEPIDADIQTDPSFDLAAASEDPADSPLAKILTKGIPGESLASISEPR